MVSFKFATLAVAALSALNVVAQVPDGVEVEDIPGDAAEIAAAAGKNIEELTIEDMQNYMASGDKSWEDKKPNTPLKVDVNTSFPDAEIFGVKLVNGRPTRSLMRITNNEDTEVTILVAMGGLLSPLDTPGAPDPPQTLRNLTGARYGMVLAPHTAETITYSFATVMQPQDLTLELKTVISRGPDMFTLTTFRENVSVVEAPVSIFDPQIIFLYLFLAGAFGGTCYFIYSTWITTLFPRRSAAARAASVRSDPLPAQSPSTHPTKSPLLELMARLSRLALRDMMRAGFLPST